MRAIIVRNQAVNGQIESNYIDGSIALEMRRKLNVCTCPAIPRISKVFLLHIFEFAVSLLCKCQSVVDARLDIYMHFEILFVALCVT